MHASSPDPCQSSFIVVPLSNPARCRIRLRGNLIMRRAVSGSWIACCAAGVLLLPGARAHAQDDAYLRTCAACHGPELRGGETGPALIGSTFQQHWASVPAVGLEEFTRRTMPPTAPGSLSNEDYAAALGRVRRANG